MWKFAQTWSMQPLWTLWRCANQFPVFLAIVVDVLQPVAIWLYSEPKRQPYGPRSFAVLVATSWNSLPQSFRDTTPTLGQFQCRLKTSLFRLTYRLHFTARSWLSRLLERRTINIWTKLNYLLIQAEWASNTYKIVIFEWYSSILTELLQWLHAYSFRSIILYFSVHSRFLYI